MRPRIQAALTGLAMALLAGTGVLGSWRLVDPSRNLFDRSEYEEARETVRFLDEARRTIPAGARTLVVTSAAYTPDFHFWFGLRGTCDWLQVIDRDQFARIAQAVVVPSREALENYYDGIDRLLTTARLERRKQTFGWIVCVGADCKRKALECDPALRSRIRLERDAGLVAVLED
jgi:hypothetical protein